VTNPAAGGVFDFHALELGLHRTRRWPPLRARPEFPAAGLDDSPCLQGPSPGRCPLCSCKVVGPLRERPCRSNPRCAPRNTRCDTRCVSVCLRCNKSLEGVFACLTCFFPGGELIARLLHERPCATLNFPSVPFWSRTVMLHFDMKLRSIVGRAHCLNYYAKAGLFIDLCQISRIGEGAENQPGGRPDCACEGFRMPAVRGGATYGPKLDPHERVATFRECLCSRTCD
jgi:hypothetical protein